MNLPRVKPPQLDSVTVLQADSVTGQSAAALMLRRVRRGRDGCQRLARRLSSERLTGAASRDLADLERAAAAAATWASPDSGRSDRSDLYPFRWRAERSKGLR